MIMKEKWPRKPNNEQLLNQHNYHCVEVYNDQHGNYVIELNDDQHIN